MITARPDKLLPIHKKLMCDLEVLAIGKIINGFYFLFFVV